MPPVVSKPCRPEVEQPWSPNSVSCLQQASLLCNKHSGNAGQKRADLVVQVPASSAPKEKLPVGAQVQLSNGMVAKVLEVTDEQITIDANPELAGQSLTFEVELVKLQKVSAASPALAGTKLLVAAKQVGAEKKGRPEVGLACGAGQAAEGQQALHPDLHASVHHVFGAGGCHLCPLPAGSNSCWLGAAAEGDDRRLVMLCWPACLLAWAGALCCPPA